MTFGVKKVDYSNLYDKDNDTEVANTKAGRTYKVVTAGNTQDLSALGGKAAAATNDVFVATAAATSDFAANWVEEQAGHLIKAPSEGAAAATNTLTALIEVVQGRINTARVQAGSQYAALESAVGYVTDLTAQYELGYNTVNDVNFSMETAHLAKNQILQQAATAMLAQANQGQQSLLQLIQG